MAKAPARRPISPNERAFRANETASMGVRTPYAVREGGRRLVMFFSVSFRFPLGCVASCVYFLCSCPLSIHPFSHSPARSSSFGLSSHFFDLPASVCHLLFFTSIIISFLPSCINRGPDQFTRLFLDTSLRYRFSSSNRYLSRLVCSLILLSLDLFSSQPWTVIRSSRRGLSKA